MMGLEGAEAPFQKLAGFGRTIAGGLQPVDDDDEALPILDRGAGQAVAGFVHIAGFQAVGADIHRQQRIAVDADGSCSR